VIAARAAARGVDASTVDARPASECRPGITLQDTPLLSTGTEVAN
jgi:hypothetical protein